jgi:hypothetical protein
LGGGWILEKPRRFIVGFVFDAALYTRWLVRAPDRLLDL